VYSFDRTLGDRQRWGDVADEWAGRLAAVGEAAVVYGSGSRLTATPRSGSPLVARELRLAAGEHLVAVSDAGFATRGGEPADGERVAVTDEPGTGGAPGLLVAALGGATAAVLLGGAAGILLRRRRDPAPPSV
jgi:hypothetical protein